MSVGVPAVLECIGVCHDDGKRLDGVSSIPWLQGSPLLWDFTCSDTLAPSNLSTSASGAAGWQTLRSQLRSGTILHLFASPLYVLRPWCLGTMYMFISKAYRFPGNGAVW